MNPTQQEIELAAAAIANMRGGRRGAPAINNILSILPLKLRAEVMQDAEAALKAAFPPADVSPQADGITPNSITRP